MSICSYSKNPKTTTTSTPTSSTTKKLRDEQRYSNNFLQKGAQRKPLLEQKRGSGYQTPRTRKGQRVGRYEKYAPGGSYVDSNGDVKENPKKVSMNHLLNFKFEPRENTTEASYAVTKPKFKRNGYRKNSTTSFTKERFLQANSQFTVTEHGDYDINFTDPDAPVPWDKIEQVFFKVENELICPICLDPPSVGKITKCGHIYCWPCILHYLALDDKGHDMRDCPICGVDVCKNDLRSVSICEEIPLCIGAELKMLLMSRSKDSLTPHPVEEAVNREVLHKEKVSKVSMIEVLDLVVEPELAELKRKLDDDLDDLEREFVNSALAECKGRKAKLLENITEHIPHGKLDNADSDILSEIADDDDTQGQNSKQKYHGDSGQYFFYQADDRDHVFLDGLNAKCLLKEYGSFKNCPSTIVASVVHCESFVMTEELRKRHKYISHLPLSCEYKMVELEFKPPLISQSVLDEFKGQILRRAKNREKKEKEENDSKKRSEMDERRRMRDYYKMSSFQALDPVVLSSSAQTGSVSVLMTGHSHESEVHFSSASPPEYSISPSDTSGSSSSKSFADMLKNGETTAFLRPRKPPVDNHPTATCSNIRPPENSDDEAIDPEYSAPAYQSSFGDALSMALDSLSVSPSGGATSTNKAADAGKGGKRQKKKKKQTLLFSTSAHMNP